MNNGSFDPKEYGHNPSDQQQNTARQPNYQKPNYQQPNYQQQAPQQQTAYQQPYYQQQAYQPPVNSASQPGLGQAIAAMICGIASIAFGILPAAIVAIVLANVAKIHGCTSGMAKAGLITGIIGIVLSIIYIIVLTVIIVNGVGYWEYYFYR